VNGARVASMIVAAAAVTAFLPGFARAQDVDTTAVFDSTAAFTKAPADSTPAPPARTRADNGLIYLVPEMAEAGYRISPERERFRHRLSFSPGVGQLGKDDLFAFRLGFSPSTWLEYEVSLGHDPASSLHALLHTFNVLVRYPFPGRVQPYASMGYGMMTVYPGKAINADPVTKNTLTFGGGLEIYIRDDVALRGEMRRATVLGQELGSRGTVAYDYREYTLGFAFYRKLGG
jgi:Outer membrane protein beta-barrel domain